MIMKKILIDASSAILLFKAGLFENLLRLYRARVADAVYDELIVDGRMGADEFRIFCLDGKLDVCEKNNEGTIAWKEYPDVSFLGRGERETILRYIQGGGEFIIIDDFKGARYCRDNKIPYINALLTPRVLFFSGDISETAHRSGTETILRIGRYSQKIIDFAMSRTKDDLEFFLP